MANRSVVVMPGDGIGNLVLPEALRVLEAAGFEADWVSAGIGWEHWVEEGNPLPEKTVELIAEHKVALFGAITSKPKDKAAAEISPALRDKGHVYFSPIVGLRQRFDLDVSIRPCIAFPGNPLNFIRRGADGGAEEPRVNAPPSVTSRERTWRFRPGSSPEPNAAASARRRSPTPLPTGMAA
jgi:3-isopropylmalate dehydrogenase